MRYDRTTLTEIRDLVLKANELREFEDPDLYFYFVKLKVYSESLDAIVGNIVFDPDTDEFVFKPRKKPKRA